MKVMDEGYLAHKRCWKVGKAGFHITEK